MGARSASGLALAFAAGLALGGSSVVVALAVRAIARATAPGLAAAAGVALASIALGLVGAIPRRGRGAGFALLLVAFSVGLVRGGAHGIALDRAREAFPIGGLHRIVGVVEGHPGRAGTSALVTLRIVAAEPALPSGARVRLRAPSSPEVEWGDRVETLAALEAPALPRNPGGWDARASADAAGLVAGGRAIVVRRVDSAGTTTWSRATRARWRRSIEHALLAGLGPVARELAPPLVTGDRSGIPAGIVADFRAAGLVHLLALSGLHVSALAAVARMAAASAGGGVSTRAIVGAAAALFYVALAGPLPSLLRAATGECLLAGARVLRRPADPVQALAVSAIALLAWHPGWIHDLGFQLSCVATAGLALSAPWLAAWRGRGAAFARPGLMTFAAQLACAPILLANFHGLAWPALAGNLVAVPLCGLLLASSWLAIGIGFLLPLAAHPFFAACEPLARALVAVSAVTARWPGAILASGHEPGVVALSAAGTLLLALAASAPRDLDARSRRVPPGYEFALGLGALAGVLAIVLAASARPLLPPRGETWIVALDVGQGDATALAGPGGWTLVDAGPRTPGSDAGERVVRPFLRWAAVRSLRALVLTHADTDHTGGADAVLRGVRVGQVIGPAVTHAPAGVRTLAARGDTIDRDPAIVVRWPPGPRGDPFDRSIAARSDNAGGLVLEVGNGGTRAWLMADVDSLVEARLAPASPVALLKIGHHGSASSTGSGWLSRARPGRAWISVGERNAYSHPARATLERLRHAGVAFDRTDRDGARWYVLDERGVRTLDWRSGEVDRGRRMARDDGRSGRFHAASAPRHR